MIERQLLDMKSNYGRDQTRLAGPDSIKLAIINAVSSLVAYHDRSGRFCRTCLIVCTATVYTNIHDFLCEVLVLVFQFNNALSDCMLFGNH